MTTRLGWMVIESTSRPGCDVSEGTQQYWSYRDAIDEAKRLRAERADDEHYAVEVRRETTDD